MFDEAAAQFEAEILISPQSELPLAELALLNLQRHATNDAIRPAERSVSLRTRPRRPTMCSAEFTSNSAGTIWPFSNFRAPQICRRVVRKSIFSWLELTLGKICRKKPQRRGPSSRS
jgi:hypothetical protein